MKLSEIMTVESQQALVLANNDKEPSCISSHSRNFFKYTLYAQACKIIICSAGANAHNYYYDLLVRQMSYLPYRFRCPCMYISVQVVNCINAWI